ncbi:low molecular weight phosphotyrosine protein phosphatase [bacterium]|nr:low molecular weight phosphotyrosine protein phosphatase [bacterium]
MKKIMFICHGNICRSPMAEFIMKDIVKKNHKENDYYISSSAVSDEEIYRGIGNPIYPPAKKALKDHNIEFSEHYAVILKKEDYDKYDLLIAMDSYNMRLVNYIIGHDKLNKVHKLLEYTNNIRDVSDPWYTRDFDRAFNDIKDGCLALFNYLESKK